MKFPEWVLVGAAENFKTLYSVHQGECQSGWHIAITPKGEQHNERRTVDA
jgi:hypothetical protein